MGHGTWDITTPNCKISIPPFCMSGLDVVGGRSVTVDFRSRIGHQTGTTQRVGASLWVSCGLDAGVENGRCTVHPACCYCMVDAGLW